jgi:DNA-binding protein H-NS
MATYKQLLAEKEKLEAQLEQVRQDEISGVIGQIHALMEEYGLTVEDLGRRRSRKGPKAESVAKYRDPKSGKTWSGRGRAPAWLGKNRDRFLIAE